MELLTTALNLSSYKRFEYSEDTVYNKDELCIYGLQVFTSLSSNNYGNHPTNPLYWYAIGKINDPTLDKSIPDGKLLVQKSSDKINYFVVNSINGQKYIKVK